MNTPSSGRLALETHAADALDALSTVEAAAWSSAGSHDMVDMVDLLARVVAAPHGLEPLTRPTVLGPSPWEGHGAGEWRAFGDLTDAQRTSAAFAEQFALDVATIDDDQRSAIGGALGAATGDVVQALWALDMIPRLRAALDALFGPSSWPAAGVLGTDADADIDVWTALDRYIHVVPALEHLDPVTTELVRLRGARAHRCRLCQSLRSRPALLAGADDATFASIDDYEASDLPAPAKAALALTDAMVWLPGHIDPVIVAAVRAHLDDATCVELVLDVARNATNKIAVAFAADAPHVTEGYEIYEITADGEAHYGLTLE